MNTPWRADCRWILSQVSPNPKDEIVEAMMEEEFSKACHVLFADPEIVKYTRAESAPTSHGLFITTSAGEIYEVSITRKA